MYGLQDVKELEIVDPLLIQQQCLDSHAACGEDLTTTNVLSVTYESIQENGEIFLLVIQRKKKGCYAVILLQAARKKATKEAQAKIQLEVLIASNRLPSIQAAKKNKFWKIFSKKEGPSVTKNYVSHSFLRGFFYRLLQKYICIFDGSLYSYQRKNFLRFPKFFVGKLYLEFTQEGVSSSNE